MAASIKGDFVVFLIGMRINKPWKVSKWLPVFLAMPRMIKELEKLPAADTGFHSSVLAQFRTSGSLCQISTEQALSSLDGFQQADEECARRRRNLA
jgi:hypothetical protein